MYKNFLIVGADTCIGYALWKRLMIEKEFCIYGINTRFNHYGNKSFQYAFNRNVYDEAEVHENAVCRAYLSEKNYDAVFWCDAVWTEAEATTIYGRVAQFFRIMDGIRYQKIFFWVREEEKIDEVEAKFPTDNSIAIAVPNVYGIYQEKGDIIPRIIMNDRVEDFCNSEVSEKFISAWSIAEAIIDNHYTDLDQYAFSLPIKCLVALLEDMKKNEMPDLQVCREILRTDDENEARRILYYLLEMIEFYTSNEWYYSKKE